MVISMLLPPDSGNVAVRPRTKVPLPARESSRPRFLRFSVGARHRRVVQRQFVGQIAQARQAIARTQASGGEIFFDQIGNREIGGLADFGESFDPVMCRATHRVLVHIEGLNRASVASKSRSKQVKVIACNDRIDRIW